MSLSARESNTKRRVVVGHIEAGRDIWDAVAGSKTQRSHPGPCKIGADGSIVLFSSSQVNAGGRNGSVFGDQVWRAEDSRWSPVVVRVLAIGACWRAGECGAIGYPFSPDGMPLRGPDTGLRLMLA